MDEIIYTVVSVALAAALSGFVAYRGKDKWHKIAVSSILLSAIATPVISAVSEISLGEFEDIFDIDSGGVSSDEFERVGKEAFEDAVRHLAAERAGIAEGSVLVTAEGYDPERVKSRLIKITLVGEGLRVDYRALENYIRGLNIGECEVKYGVD